MIFAVSQAARASMDGFESLTSGLGRIVESGMRATVTSAQPRAWMAIAAGCICAAVSLAAAALCLSFAALEGVRTSLCAWSHHANIEHQCVLSACNTSVTARAGKHVAFILSQQASSSAQLGGALSNWQASIQGLVEATEPTDEPDTQPFKFDEHYGERHDERYDKKYNDENGEQQLEDEQLGESNGRHSDPEFGHYDEEDQPHEQHDQLNEPEDQQYEPQGKQEHRYEAYEGEDDLHDERYKQQNERYDQHATHEQPYERHSKQHDQARAELDVEHYEMQHPQTPEDEQEPKPHEMEPHNRPNPWKQGPAIRMPGIRGLPASPNSARLHPSNGHWRAL